MQANRSLCVSRSKLNVVKAALFELQISSQRSGCRRRLPGSGIAATKMARPASLATLSARTSLQQRMRINREARGVTARAKPHAWALRMLLNSVHAEKEGAWRLLLCPNGLPLLKTILLRNRRTIRFTPDQRDNASESIANRVNQIILVPIVEAVTNSPGTEGTGLSPALRRRGAHPAQSVLRERPLSGHYQNTLHILHKTPDR